MIRAILRSARIVRLFDIPGSEELRPIKARYILSHPVKRTSHTMSPFAQYVSIDHGRADVFVVQEHLDSADVVLGFEQVCSERAPGLAGR